MDLAKGPRAHGYLESGVFHKHLHCEFSNMIQYTW
jgi:hypothetical protein